MLPAMTSSPRRSGEPIWDAAGTKAERRMAAKEGAPPSQPKPGIIGWSAVIGIFVVIGLCSLAIAAKDSGKDHTRDISRSDLGDSWPLTAESGVIECRDGNQIVFTSGGVTYGVNGIARSNHKYRDIMTIWAPDPVIPGLRKNMQDLTDAGLALC
jgi:hypothetical protein